MKLTDQTINHKRPFICVHDFVFVLVQIITCEYLNLNCQ